MEPIAPQSPTETRRAKFEVRPSPLRAWNPEAPDEIVFTDGKPRGFGDLLQAINPLHHLPVVGTLYREFTGATIEPAARVIGGLVFGGPVGLASAMVNALVEEESGKDIGGHLAAMVRPAGDDPALPPPPPAPGARPGGSPDQSPDGALFLASLNSTHRELVGGGTYESDGLLSTWIASGAPVSRPEMLEVRAPATERPMPTHLPLYAARLAPQPPPTSASASDTSASEPVARPTAATPPAALSAAAATPAPAVADAPEFLPTTGRGRTLADYRATAHALPPSAMRMPAITDPLANQRAATRTAAVARTDAVPPPAALSPALEAQRQAEAGLPTGEQGWVAMMMAAGLDRYRAVQRQRDVAAPSAL